MNKLEEMKYIRELEEKKSKLRKQIDKINKEIINQRKACSHITVDLGYYGLYPSTGDEYCCILCGMGKNREYYYESKYMVHAEDYLPQLSIQNDDQCIEKLERIQELALKVLEENPDISNEELTSKLNEMITISILESQKIKENDGPKLNRKLNN